MKLPNVLAAVTFLIEHKMLVFLLRVSLLWVLCFLAKIIVFEVYFFESQDNYSM